MDTREQIQALLDRPEWSEAESMWMLGLLENGGAGELGAALEERFRADLQAKAPTDMVRAAEILALLHEKMKDTETPVRRMFPYKWAAAAAIALLLLIPAIYYYQHSRSTAMQGQSAEQLAAHDIKAPSCAHATITLANGQQIILDSAAKGLIGTQKNIKLLKLGDGKITYNGDAQPKNEIEYNTLSNPRGSMVIEITLSDGSQIWLNAGSSLKYPTAFTGSERKVEIAGEAYFEVAHNAAMPFIVKKDSTEVRVLGTHFNVNAYPDEGDIKVTLLEGSVEVSHPSPRGEEQGVRRLSPGEQAALSLSKGDIKIIPNADIEQTLAWKNGLFVFRSGGIETIMREISRWYDIDIAYEGERTKDSFSGGIARTATLAQVLSILEMSRVHFRLEGKKLTVLP